MKTYAYCVCDENGQYTVDVVGSYAEDDLITVNGVLQKTRSLVSGISRGIGEALSLTRMGQSISCKKGGGKNIGSAWNTMENSHLTQLTWTIRWS
jgi:hypothetical protein